MIEGLFFLCISAIVYPYFGYPILVAVAGRLFPRTASKPVKTTGALAKDATAAGGADRMEDCPAITLVIPAYNEAASIGRKIANCLDLDYPASRIEILLLSDGSTDGTVEIARKAASGSDRVRIIASERRRGKTAFINEAIPSASGEIIVHTDANAWLAPDAIRHITAPFADPRVGCVVGELVYTNSEEPAVRGGEGLYWRYENFLKECESRLGRTITANGGIYALRKALFQPLPEHIAGDAADPLRIAAMGYVTLFERRAIARERASSSLGEEFGRKVRIMTQGIAACVVMKSLLLPPRPLLAFIYISHKVLRWLAPWLLVALAATTVALVLDGAPRPRIFVSREMAAGALVAEILFLALGAWGVQIGRRASPGRGLFSRLAMTAGYFLTVNAAAMLALVNLARGVRLPMWEKSASTRHDG